MNEDKKLNLLDHLETMNVLFKRFESGNPFTYIRFGDGDLNIMHTETYKGEHYHKQNPILRQGLIDSIALNHEDYLIGTIAGDDYYYNKVLREARLVGVMKKYCNDWESRTFLSAVALERIAQTDVERLFDFFRLFQDKKVLLIGGGQFCDPKGRVARAFNISDFIAMPKADAINSLDEAKMNEIYSKIDKCDVVLSVIGLAGRVLAKRIWDKGIRTTFFDVGSVADALIGHVNRKWISLRFDHNKPLIFKRLDTKDWRLK